VWNYQEKQKIRISQSTTHPHSQFHCTNLSLKVFQ